MTSINGEVIEINTVKEQLYTCKISVKEGVKVTVVIARELKGKVKSKTLKGKALKVEKQQDYLIKFNKNATEKQIQIRNAWLEQK